MPPIRHRRRRLTIDTGTWSRSALGHNVPALSEDLDARMAGIERGHSDAFPDEHPDAYKDIDTVMNDAADLVTIDHTLRQIVNVKGD